MFKLFAFFVIVVARVCRLHNFAMLRDDMTDAEMATIGVDTTGVIRDALLAQDDASLSRLRESAHTFLSEVVMEQGRRRPTS
jgi:hypothetical protein